MGLIAHVAVSSTDSNTITTASINTTGANFLVLVAAILDTSSVTISDSKANTWTPLTEYGTSAPHVRLYYATAPTVGTAHTFTITCTAKYPALCIAAFDGRASSLPFDVENGAFNTATTLQPGSITPSAANELIISGYALNDTVGTVTASIDSGFTLTDMLSEVSGKAWGVGLAYKIQTSAVAVNPTWTESAAAANATATIASFKASAGGSLASVVPATGTVLVANGTAQRVNFTGSGTAWASAPTITVSAGALGAITVDTTTTAHATYTPPVAAQTVTFTDTTDGSTTATLVIAATATSYSLAGPATGSVNVASTAFTVTLTPASSALDVAVTVTPAISASGTVSGTVVFPVNTPTASGTFTVTPTSVGAHTVSVTHSPP